RAPHVDVNDVGAEILDDARRLGHLDRVTAEDLDGDWALFLGVLRVLERTVDAAHEPFGADHLGDDKAAAALALDQPAEGAVRHPGHGGDGERRRQLDVADSHIGCTSAASTWTLTARPISSTESTSRAW